MTSEAAFYSQSNPGVVRITDVLILTPRNGPPPSPVEGTIYVDANTHHIYRYLNGSWRQLD